MVTQKQGRQLKVGDVLAVGSRHFKIVSFSTHPGFNGQSARIASYLVDNRESENLTIFDDEWFVEDRTTGMTYYRHHWNNAKR